MLKSYLQITMRLLLRQKGYTLINILGLSIGIAGCLLFSLYLSHEWGYDHFWTDADRIYRVVHAKHQPDQQIVYSDAVPSVFDESIEGQVPGIEVTARATSGPVSVRQGTEDFSEELLYVDPSFFTIFKPEVLAGNSETFFNHTGSVVISSDLAKKYFPDGDALGQELILRQEETHEPFLVSGILENIPKNSSFHADLFLPFALEEKIIGDTYGLGWGSVFSATYVKLKEGADPVSVEQGIARIMDENGVTEEWRKSFPLQPLKETHVTIRNPHGYPTDTTPLPMVILGAIALIILLVACINFTTLAIGRANTRIREVGVRKVLGAFRSEVIHQFWVETGVITLGALLLALGITELVLPTFSQFSGMTLTFRLDGTILAALFVLWVGIIFVAGSYPALYLSRFNPSQAFRGGIRHSDKRRIRRSLVFVQFTLSITLIVLTISMRQQLAYIQQRNLGYSGDQIVQLPVTCRDDSGAQALETLRTALQSEPGVMGVTGSSCSFGVPWTFMNWTDEQGGEVSLHTSTVDHAFLDVFGIELVQGRGFSPEYPSDLDQGMIVNEALVRYFGLENPIGRSLPGPNPNKWTIVGVVKDFHFSSLHEEIGPVVLSQTFFQPPSNSYHTLSENYITIQQIEVRLARENIPASMRRIEYTWRDQLPGFPWNPRFVDENVNEMYQDDRRWGKIVTAAAGLALVIALMGLVGLISLEVSQRTREIGIRKVLGATSLSLIVLLGRELTLLVIGANLVAAPLAWFGWNRWIENFAYQSPATSSPYLIAGGSVLLLAWLGIALLSWQAAAANPVKSLRYE